MATIASGRCNDRKRPAFLEKLLAEISAESERVLGRDLVSQQIEYFEEESV